MPMRLDDLRESNEFLNSLIDNINSAVFLLDKSLKIQQFNRALQILFNRPDDVLAGELCGNAIGCSFAVLEKAPCGETSHCRACELRTSAELTFTGNAGCYRKKLVREFYIEAKPVLKHLEYTTKWIHFSGQEMILIIVDDVTEGELQKLELLEKQERIDEDLRAAAAIQRSLLPQRLPQLEELEIAWKFLPCDLIGGDLFNVFLVDDDHIGCYMLDVSGHGVPSALVSVSASRTLQPAPPLNAILSPAAMCAILDREYPLERFNKFMTLVYLVVNFRAGYLVYSNAGHVPVLLMHADGSLEQLSRGGTVIGLGASDGFEEERKELQAGDKIILYTDGVVEHRNSEGEFYREERFFAQLQRLNGQPVERILAGVVESILEHGNNAGFRDDVSLLGIEIKASRQGK